MYYVTYDCDTYDCTTSHYDCDKRQNLWKAADPPYLKTVISGLCFFFISSFSYFIFFPFSLTRGNIAGTTSKRYFYDFCNQFLAPLDMSAELMKSTFIRRWSYVRQSAFRPSVCVAIIFVPNGRISFKF